MGERSNSSKDDLTTPRAIEREVEFLRQRTEALLSELESRIGHRLEEARARVRRLRPAFEVAVFFRRHRAAAIVISASTLFLLGGMARLLIRSQRRLLGRVRATPPPPKPPRRRLLWPALEGAVLATLLSLVTNRRA